MNLPVSVRLISDTQPSSQIQSRAFVKDQNTTLRLPVSTLWSDFFYKKKMAGHTHPYRDNYGDRTQTRDEREIKVHELVDRYESLREPSTALRHIYRDSDLCRLFCEIVEQQIKLVKSRRQEFDDGRVTVFDKALKELSSNGDTASNLGVQELYIREYIGINPEAPLRDIEDTLAKNILIKSFFTKC